MSQNPTNQQESNRDLIDLYSINILGGSRYAKLASETHVGIFQNGFKGPVRRSEFKLLLSRMVWSHIDHMIEYDKKYILTNDNLIVYINLNNGKEFKHRWQEKRQDDIETHVLKFKEFVESLGNLDFV